MKKRVLSLVLAFMLCLGLLPAAASAATDLSGTWGDGMSYHFDGSTGTLTISGQGEITPSGYGWISVLYPWNEGWNPWDDDIISVVIEEGVTGIGTEAFLRCAKLTSVTIPGSLTKWGSDVFKGCDRLTTVTVKSGATIGGSAFWSCDNLSNVTLEQGVREIGGSAFAYCSSLTSIHIPGSVTTIGNGAFLTCNNLTDVTLEEGIIEIQSNAFNTERQLNALIREPSKLASLTIPASVQVMDDITAEDTDIIFADGRTTIGKDISFYISAGRSVTIPASVTKIEAKELWVSEDATVYYGGTAEQWQALYEKYADNEKYQSLWDAKVVFGDGRTQEFVVNNGVLEQYRGPGGAVVVPGNVTRVADHAFTFNSSFVDKYSDGNHKITSIVFPEGVEEIGSSACSGLSNLTSVTFPKSLRSIGDRAFSSTGLTNVTFPEGLKSIGDKAFSDTGLTGLTFPKSLESIGEDAFGYCRKLTTVTFHPDSNTNIGNYAFSDYDSLVTVTLPNRGYLGEFCFSPRGTILPSHRIKSVTVPAGVTVAWSAFVEDEYLEGTVETVYGVPGSSAEYWATRSNNVTFVPIEDTATPEQPQLQMSPWAESFVNRAFEIGLVPDGLGNDYRASITRSQFAAAAVKLYEAMSGQKAPAAGNSPFTDTSDTAVIQAQALGIVYGVEVNKFDPDALVTREQAATMLSRVYTKLGGNIPKASASVFVDNGEISDWAMDAVVFMTEHSILLGTGEGQFSPMLNASIEEALIIALRMFDNLK